MPCATCVNLRLKLINMAYIIKESVVWNKIKALHVESHQLKINELCKKKKNTEFSIADSFIFTWFFLFIALKFHYIHSIHIFSHFPTCKARDVWFKRKKKWLYFPHVNFSLDSFIYFHYYFWHDSFIFTFIFHKLCFFTCWFVNGFHLIFF